MPGHGTKGPIVLLFFHEVANFYPFPEPSKSLPSEPFSGADVLEFPGP